VSGRPTPRAARVAVGRNLQTCPRSPAGLDRPSRLSSTSRGRRTADHYTPALTTDANGWRAWCCAPGLLLQHPSPPLFDSWRCRSPHCVPHGGAEWWIELNTARSPGTSYEAFAKRARGGRLKEPTAGRSVTSANSDLARLTSRRLASSLSSPASSSHAPYRAPMSRQCRGWTFASAGKPVSEPEPID
jgi:hypothetical protein